MKIIELTQRLTIAITNEEAEMLDSFDETNEASFDKIEKCSHSLERINKLIDDARKFQIEINTTYKYIKQIKDIHQSNIIQFELRDAYLAFQYAFAGQIIEDVTMKEYR